MLPTPFEDQEELGLPTGCLLAQQFELDLAVDARESSIPGEEVERRGGMRGRGVEREGGRMRGKGGEGGDGGVGREDSVGDRCVRGEESEGEGNVEREKEEEKVKKAAT